MNVACARRCPEISVAAPATRESWPRFSKWRRRRPPSNNQRCSKGGTNMRKSDGVMTRGEGARVTRRTLLAAGAAATGTILAPRALLTPAIAQSAAVRVGVLAPLSGVYASLGANKVNGIKMLLNEKQMRVADRPIELVIEDDEAKPQEGLRKARKLVEQDNVDVLLGVISSAIGYPLKEYVVRAKKVWVTTGAAADGIFKKANNNPYAYRASLSVWQANDPMGTWLADTGFNRDFVTGPDYAMGREALE